MDREAQTTELFNRHFDAHRDQIITELGYAQAARDASKDIIIVAHNQLNYLKACVESIQANTRNYHLYIWDNASDADTERYLDRLLFTNPGVVEVMRSDENIGFIKPNNELVEWGTGEYVILLNSDTKVFEGWDASLLGYLQHHPETALVGYLGGVLDGSGYGYRSAFGGAIDYVAGWCVCLERKTYAEYDLFNEELVFAYCEDADLSLRLQAAGRKVYALHLMLVHHFENKTITAVRDEGRIDVRATFDRNHDYMRRRWKDYLERQRIDVRTGKDSHDGTVDGEASPG